MRLAPVAPIGILERIAGPYNLVIANDVLKNINRYHQLFHRIQDMHGPDTVTLLDNGVIELGKSLDVKRLVTAARVINATAVMLPDIPFEREKTLELSKKAIEQFRELAPTLSLIGVAQGERRNADEFLQCAQEFADLGINWIALPRFSRPVVQGQRWRTVKQLLELRPDLNIHLLGFCDNRYDDWEAAKFPNVSGIDSATPVWQSIDPQLMRRPKDYWDWTAEKIDQSPTWKLQWWRFGQAVYNFLPRGKYEQGVVKSRPENTSYRSQNENQDSVSGSKTGTGGAVLPAATDG